MFRPCFSVFTSAHVTDFVTWQAENRHRPWLTD
ncbi:hypothetical protein STAFG_6452 [Streptomyces afghaniensis 772]|uniref:Uncharacterized protein n=1 Tax=Streptomyces afghaniensis 772 TaxID=1283301 RepID=S4MLG1_9ACTN|nr:hypothetical protein STAFG_6452 [Streptomyces afghaniensis 772]